MFIVQIWHNRNSAWMGSPKWDKSATVGFPYVCNQAGRREDPRLSWLWEKNINLLPGKLSGKGLVGRCRSHWCVPILSSFHPGSSTGSCTMTTNEKGCARGKILAGQAGHNSCSSDAMLGGGRMKHLWKWLCPGCVLCLSKGRRQRSGSHVQRVAMLVLIFVCLHLSG